MSKIIRVYHADCDGYETTNRDDAVGFGAKLSCGHDVFNLKSWGSSKPKIDSDVSCDRCSGRVSESLAALIKEAIDSVDERSALTVADLRRMLEDEKSRVCYGEWVRGQSGTWSLKLADNIDVKLSLNCSSEQEVKGRLRVGKRITRVSISVFCYAPMYRNIYSRSFASVRGEDASARQKIDVVKKRALDLANNRFGLNAGEFDFDFS